MVQTHPLNPRSVIELKDIFTNLVTEQEDKHSGEKN